MNDMGDAFDERIRDAARDYNEPPAPPREEMWAAIRRARSDEISRTRASRLAGWGWRITGLAAAIVVGIALGRMTATRAPVDTPSTIAQAPAGPDRDRSADTDLYDVAATEHLGRAEALLVQFRTASTGAPVDGQVVMWARDLLMSTRLLLDSPAAQNAEIHALLEDLELVLVQIVQLPGGGVGERELVEEGIEGRHMLLRLRAAVPSGPVRVGA